MSEKEDTIHFPESENCGCDDDIDPDTSASPCRSTGTGAVKKVKPLSGNSSSGLSHDKTICSNDKFPHKTVSYHFIPQDLDKINLTLDDKNSPRKSLFLGEIHKRTISDNSLPWNDGSENVEMKGPPSEINMSRDLDKINLNSDGKNSPRKSVFRGEIPKRTISDDSLPWNKELENVEMKGPPFEINMSRNRDKINLNLDGKNSPRKSGFRGEIPKRTISDDSLSWNEDSENVEMKGPPSEINILLLGESGVGKSTFINSFANYMKHENFEAVQDNDLSVLIPARFNIFDKFFEKHVIEIGANDENEHLVDGAAATQDVKTYVFYITLDNRPFMIRLIDTPGMGDPRGIDRDNKNCDYVLNYIGKLKKIHAICLLLRPTNTRLDVFLNYCVTQILSRLEKSATDNIAFLFTNTRGQNYTPGDTYTSLEVLVKRIKDTNNVTLPLSHKNVFCFDNEAFRFLASIKQGVQFREGILEANIESWKYSYKEVYRVLSYIVQLKPHDPQKTISINHARQMVMQLSQPLAEIVQLIGDNIYQLDQHTHQLLIENQTLDELKQKLYMPIIDIRAKELTHPVTVCTASKCCTTYKVGDKTKLHFSQRCHNPCYLNDVPKEIIGDPHLLECWAITTSTQTCHQCGCKYNTHMHIYYETETFQSNIVDVNIQNNISNKEDATRGKAVIIDKIVKRKEELDKEHKFIIKCSAAFAHFLQQNAITPMNDSLREYVKYLIKREENLGTESDLANLEYLRRLLSEYEQEKKVLNEALKHNTSGITHSSPNLIDAKIRELFTLPNFGKKIKELYDLHQSGGMREHKQSEFVVKERYTLGVFDKVLGMFGLGETKKQHRLELERQRALDDQRLELEYYNRQLQRQGRHLNYQYANRNFEPNGPRHHHNDIDQYYTREAPERPLPSERQHSRRQYESGYDPREEERRAYLDLNRHNFRNTSSGHHRDGDHNSRKKCSHNDSAFSDGQRGCNCASEMGRTSEHFYANSPNAAQISQNTEAFGRESKGARPGPGKGETLSTDCDAETPVTKIDKSWW